MMPSRTSPKSAATLRAFLIGAALSGLFAWISVMRNNFPPQAFLSENLIPVLPHLTLLIAGLLINPVLRRVPIMRLFSKGEVLLIFLMCAVAAGLASFGLSAKLVSTVSGLSNPAKSTEQSLWDVHAAPFMNEKYFIAEKGTQALAKEVREHHLAYEKARHQLQTARDLKLARTELDRLASEMASTQGTTDAAEREVLLKMLEYSRRRAQELLATAMETWQQIGAGLDAEVVAETYDDKVTTLKTERDALRESLKTLNADAFEAVETVRKGFPQEKRAIPGFLYVAGEGYASYKARFERLHVGSGSYDRLKACRARLSSAIERDAPLSDTWPATLREAAGMLESIADIPALSARYERRAAELARLEDALAEKRLEVRKLRDMRRYARENQFEEFDTRIATIDEQIVELSESTDALRGVVENQLEPHLEVCGRVRDTRAALQELADLAATTPKADYATLQERLNTLMAGYASFDASARRYWLGDIRWKLWLGPIANWLVIIFTVYLIFMCFNTLIFRQWAHNEKLIYPLAEIASVLASSADPNQKQGTLYRSGLFWTGFLLSAGILGWNHVAGTGVIPNVNPVKLQTLWLWFVSNSPLSGLGSTYFCIVFAVIGITFLVPANISFSLWFFEILYMCLLLVMAALGYGHNRWSLGNVGRTEIGSGAILVFGAVILWTCRHYLICAFRPTAIKALAGDERKELRIASAMFIGSSMLLVLMLSLGLGANLLMVVIYYLFVLAMTITLIRVVAEGGVLGMESHAGVLGMMKTFFGISGGAWLSPVLLAPLVVFTGFVFGGFKSFIAAMMANAFKLREEIQIRRLHFHAAIWTGIGVATLVSTLTIIILSYQHGADNLNDWINADDAMQSTVNWTSDAAEIKPSDRRWMLSGAILMGLLLFGRSRFFGIPHPIGLLMIVNPVMFGFWGSILIGWLLKSVVSKYCNHEQYLSIRRFFIGLVLGHLAAVLFGWDQLNFHWG